jgi:hypothetical protein
MENYKEQFEDLESKLKSDFSADLKGLCEPPNPVPSSVDKKIIAMAQKKFGSRRSYKLLRWLAPLAAAAVIIAIVSLNMPQQLSKKAVVADKEVARQTLSAPLMVKSSEILREDVDQSGTVDILDAMKLDMQIKNALHTDGGQSALRIESATQMADKYDFNKDGVVDKKDVDMVAFNAVRINKGVL